MPSGVETTSPAVEFGGSSFKNTPLRQVRVLYARFLQGLFAAAPRGSYHWEPALEDTEIVITDENPINLDVVGQRPAISLTRGPIQFYSFCLDDLMGYNFRTGAKKKTVLIPGTMSINCCSRVDIECDQLAFIISDHLWLLRGHLLKQGFFQIGQQLAIGAPSPAGSLVSGAGEDETYCTTVTSPFHFPRTGQVTPLGKQIIQSIEASLQIGGLRTYGEMGPVADTNAGAYGHELPFNITTYRPEAFAPYASDASSTPNPAGLPQNKPHLVPHPLNPARNVIIKVSKPHTPGLRPASIRGQTIPIAPPSVEESEST